MMVDNVFLEGVAHLVHEVDVYIRVVGVHLAAAFVYRHEDGFYPRGCLRHQRGGSCRCYRQTGNVPASVLLHVLIELGIGFFQAVDERIVLFAFCIINPESSTLLRHRNRCAVGVQGQCAVDVDGEVRRLLRAVTQPHGCNHVTFGGDSHAGTTSFPAFLPDFLPEVILGMLHFFRLRIVFYLFHDEVDLLHFKVDNIVHDPLCQLGMATEQVEVEVCVVSERINDIGIEVQREQAAAVVRTERNLAAGIGGDGLEAEVGITVGDALAEDGVPEQHARFGTFPCVVYDFSPQCLGRNGLRHHGGTGGNGELLYERSVGNGCLHELVGDFYRHVGPCHLALFHFRIDERL